LCLYLPCKEAVGAMDKDGQVRNNIETEGSQAELGLSGDTEVLAWEIDYW
jgi:hypothetical protein